MADVLTNFPWEEQQVSRGEEGKVLSAKHSLAAFLPLEYSPRVYSLPRESPRKLFGWWGDCFALRSHPPEDTATHSLSLED